MSQRRFVLTIVNLTLLSLCLASSGFAQKGKGGGKGGDKQSCKRGSALPNPIPVTITFRELETDRITNDLNPPQAYDANAVINCVGEIFLNSFESGSRGISLDFSDGPSPPPFSVNPIVVPFTFKTNVPPDSFESGCEGKSSAWAMDPDQQCRARVNVSFRDPEGGKWNYALRFNDTEGSTDILVTRVDNNTWNIEATGDDFTNLTQYVRNKSVVRGTYTMPFHATVDCDNTDEFEECVP